MSTAPNYSDHQSEKERLNGVIQLTEICQLTELVGSKPIAIVASHTVFNSLFVIRLKLLLLSAVFYSLGAETLLLWLLPSCLVLSNILM